MTEKIEEVFDKIAKRFRNITEFKKFALSRYGLSLSAEDVTSIVESNRFSVDDQKQQLLSLWKEKNGANATPRRIEGLVRHYYQQQAAPAQYERLEDVFLEVISRFVPPNAFRQFARSRQGLSLSYNTISTIIDDNKSSSEDCNFEILRAWRFSQPDIADGEIIQTVRQLADTFIQERRERHAAHEENIREDAAPMWGSSTMQITDKKATAAVDEFLENVNSCTQKETDSILESIKKRTHMNEVLHPMVTRLKLDGQQHAKEEKNFKIGLDIEAVDISILHNDPSANRIMLLGNTGCGKTTFARNYARLALQHKLDALKGIKLVHLVDVSKLHSTKTTTFDLIFVHQLGPEVLPPRLHGFAKEWLNKNASSVLLILDGLDQAYKAFKSDVRRITVDTEAKVNTILSNLLCGHTYSGMKILSTSRWNVYWELTLEMKPTIAFGLRGFRDEELKILISKLFEQEQHDFIHAFCQKRPGLISNPMFLFSLAKVLKLQRKVIPDSVCSLMVSLLRCFSGSQHKGFRRILTKLMKLAFDGIIKNVFIFSAKYIKSIDLNMTDMRGPVNVDADDTFLENVAEDDDMRVRFSHQSLQEILAALYAFKLTLDEFKNFINDNYDKSGMDVVLNYVFGIMLNKSTFKEAEKYIGYEKDLDAKHDFLVKYLEELLEKKESTITDARVAMILHECGSDAIKEFGTKVKNISMENKQLPDEDKMAVMAVAEQIPNITFNMWSVIVRQSNYFSLLNILNNAETVNVVHLSLYMAQINSKKLQDLIKAIKSAEGKIRFYYFSIVSDREMEVEAYYNLIEVFHYASSKWLGLLDCDLNSLKIDKCLEAALKYNVRIIAFMVDKNVDLDEETSNKLALFLNHTKAQTLGATYCTPSINQLSALCSSLENENIHLVGMGLAKSSTEILTEEELAILYQLVQTSSYAVGYRGPAMDKSHKKFLEESKKASPSGKKVEYFFKDNSFWLIDDQDEYYKQLASILIDLIAFCHKTFPDYEQNIDFNDLAKTFNNILELFDSLSDTYFENTSTFRQLSQDSPFLQILFAKVKEQFIAMKMGIQMSDE